MSNTCVAAEPKVGQIETEVIDGKKNFDNLMDTINELECRLQPVLIESKVETNEAAKEVSEQLVHLAAELRGVNIATRDAISQLLSILSRLEI